VTYPAGHHRRPARGRAVTAICALAVLGLGACGHDDSTGTGQGASSLRLELVTFVHVTDTTVQPTELSVHVGDTVGVTDAGSSPHRLSGDKLDTGLLQPHDTTLLFASKAGRFELHLDDAGAVALVITVNERSEPAGSVSN
jgi:plastocyanin